MRQLRTVSLCLHAYSNSTVQRLLPIHTAVAGYKTVSTDSMLVYALNQYGFDCELFRETCVMSGGAHEPLHAATPRGWPNS